MFTLFDVLKDEWHSLSPQGRDKRYGDHCHVNAVIARTVDAVQDSVVEPAMPMLAYVDSLCGPVDEFVISLLIKRWRESVWQHAISLLECGGDDGARSSVAVEVERETMRTASLVCPGMRP